MQKLDAELLQDANALQQVPLGFFEQVLKCLNVPTAILDKRGIILWGNEAWNAVLSHDLSQNIYNGSDYFYVLANHKSYPKTNKKRLEEFKCGNILSFITEYVSIIKTQKRWYQVTLSWLDRAEKNLIIATYEEISKLKRVHKKLDRNEEEFGTYQAKFERSIRRRTKQLAQTNERLSNEILKRLVIEKQLTEKSERLELAQKAGKIGSFEWDIRHGKILFTPELEKLYGLKPETFDGLYKTWTKMVHPDDRKSVNLALASALKNQETYSAEFRIIWPDKSIHWIYARGEIYIDPIKNVQRMIGVNMDITQQKNAEKEAKQAAAIIESSEDAIIGISAEGRISSWNNGAQHIYGYSKEDVIGKTLSVLMPNNKKNDFPRIMRLLKSGEKVEHFETQRLTKNEKIIDVSITVSAIKDERGKIIGASKISRDITEKKQIERNLEFLSEASKILSSSLDYHQTLTNVANLAVPHIADWCTVDMVTDNNSVDLLAIAHVNPQKVKWARKLRTLNPVDMTLNTGISKVLKTGKAEFYPRVTKEMIEAANPTDEQRRILKQLQLTSLMIVPLCIQNKCIGAITFISAEAGKEYSSVDLHMAEELSSRAALAIQNAQLYQEAQIGIKTRDEFLNIASHELKTPITSLQLQLQILKRKIQGGNNVNTNELVKILNTKELQMKRLTKLVNNLLDVSKINNKRSELDLEMTNLASIIDEVVERFGNPSLRVNHPSRKIIGQWDRFKIDQILTNLISNAVKYGNNKPIDIITKKKNSCVQVIINDQGIGIDPAEVGKIFEQFERTKGAKNYDGLGLGLYIAKEFASAHGGTITVNSTAGKGSSFIVQLPLSQPS